MDQITNGRINKHLQNTLKLYNAFKKEGFETEANEVLIFGSFVADLALAIAKSQGNFKNYPVKDPEVITIGDHAQSDYAIDQEAQYDK